VSSFLFLPTIFLAAIIAAPEYQKLGLKPILAS